MKNRKILWIIAVVVLAGSILAGVLAWDSARKAPVIQGENVTGSAQEPPGPSNTAPTPAPTAAPSPAAVSQPEDAQEPDPADAVGDGQAATARLLKLEMDCSEQDRLWMTDDNLWTSGYFSSEESLQLRGEEPIAYLYVIWGTRPAPWTLTAGDLRLDCGTQGFFHELVELPRTMRELTLILPKQEKTEISDLYAFSEGELPDWVQIWEPPCETADILLFPTHSDDEFIFFGGLLPSYAGEQGLEVQVAYLVDHYEWERHRWHELLNGLWTAGVRHYPVNGGFSDGKFASMDETMRYYDTEQILRWQVETLRRFRPLVAVGHDAKRGEDGSWTHALNGQSLREAVVLAGDADYDPESARQYGTWDTPKLYLHLYGDRPTVLDYDTPLARFSGKTAFQMAVEAFACHKSQQNFGYVVYGADAPYYDSHVFGLCRSLVGEDEARNDLMEHIRRSDWRDDGSQAPLA